jgi:branched-subunit amino acid aminotransferase/4-amino-4-deoxychorismate lyase
MTRHNGRMTEPLAYLNGRILPLSELSVSVFDAGFVQGATVAEQLRTFGGKLFRLDDHLARLARSLEIVGVDPGISLADIGRIATDLAARNHRLLAAGDDLGLAIFVTPGPIAGTTSANSDADFARPTVCVHTRPVAFRGWAYKYAIGVPVAISTIRQVPADCWPPELKCRSRMHYYLADREVAQRFPGARAILLQHDGTVCEATTANLLAYFPSEGLVSPPHERILPGISVATAKELATELGIPFSERDLRPLDLQAASELLLTSTSPCVLPVSRLGEFPVGDGQPGEIHARLLAAWSTMVGVDIARQAVTFRDRES